METTANMGLVDWDLPKDKFDHAALASNFRVLDKHDHTSGKGLAIGTAAIEPKAITHALLALNAVDSSNIQDGTVEAKDLAPGLVVPTGGVVMYGGDTAPVGYLMCDGAAYSRTVTYDKLFAVVGTKYGVGNGSNTFNVPNLNGRTAVGPDPSGTTLPTANTLGAKSGAASVSLGLGEIPAHGHSVSISDPGHSHGINVSVSLHDPGHNHASVGNAFIVWSSGFQTGAGFSDGVTQVYSPGALGTTTTAGATTGVTVQSASGSANSSGTGISASAASVGGSGPHTNMQPYTVLNYIIKY